MNLSSNQTYERELLNNVEAAGTALEYSEFASCEFRCCKFSEIIFNSCTFRECHFVDCSLEMMRVDKSVFKQTRFTNSKMLGINWTMASWGKREIAQLIKTINFQGCVLNYSVFMGLNLNGIHFRECTMHEVDFSEALLRKADFSGSDLQRAIFRNTDMREADFRKARNYSISSQTNTISQAKFNLPEAMNLLYAMDIQLNE